MEEKKFKFTKKTLIITLYIAVFVILAASYGISSILIKTPGNPLAPNRKNGLILDDDGEIRYYINGESIRAGLVKDDAGNYYYVNSSLKAVKNTHYSVTTTNDLLPEDTYYFGSDGKLVFEEDMNGYYIDGAQFFICINGVKQSGLFEYDGNIYYASRSTGYLKTGGHYVFASESDGMIGADGYYNFGADGKLLNPPTDDDLKKTGLFRDFDGEIRLYSNGKATHGGLVTDSSGNYYYINSSMKAVRSCSYTISITNALLPAGTYNFDSDGKMIDPPQKNS